MLLEIITPSYGIYGTLCIVVGIALFLIVGRRRFYLRNQSGLEEYKNYSSAVANSCLNKGMKLLGLGLIFMGLMLRFSACVQQENNIKKQSQSIQDSTNQPPTHNKSKKK